MDFKTFNTKDNILETYSYVTLLRVFLCLQNVYHLFLITVDQTLSIHRQGTVLILNRYTYMNNIYIITVFCFFIFKRVVSKTKEVGHIFLLLNLNVGLQFTNGII